MKFSNFHRAVLAAALLQSTTLGYANVGTSQATAKAAPGHHAGMAARTAQTKNAAAAPKPKLVDINSASKAELQTLPGITPELADKIIAGRPYNSKAFLVTRKIVPDTVYEYIRKRINTGKN
jgi:DNA uptake protein ComE-like DNA-binding protein